MSSCAIVGVLSFFLLGEGEGGLPAYFALFLGVYGASGMVNVIYLLIELRVPPDALGSSVVIVITAAVFVASLTPFVAYSGQPYPIISQIICITIGIVSTLLLPKGGFYLSDQ
jgi:hypothetical protein